MPNSEYNKIMALKIAQPCPPEFYVAVLQYARTKPGIQRQLYRWIDKSRKLALRIQ